MAHPVRRAAAVTIASALLIGAFAPLVVGSAAAPDPSPTALLAAADPTLDPLVVTASRGAASDRAAFAGRQASGPATSVGAEDLGLGLQDPPSVVMKPTIWGGATPKIVARPAPTSGSVSGKASWYCCTRGWTGQAVVALPQALGGHYDPAPDASLWVTICADRCARIPVVDACGCHYGTDAQKVADLSPEAWAAVSSKDRYIYGVVQVTIYFGS